MLLKFGLPAIAVLALIFSIRSVQTMTPVKASVAPPSQPPAAAFAKQIGAVGLVEASTENIGISLPVSGLVTRVYVKAGDSVRKGQPLFALDDRDIRAELGLRNTELDLARTKLSRLESAPRAEEIPPAEARVAEAQAQLEDTRTQLQLIESVKDKRAVREEDVQKRRRAVEGAQARVEQNQAALRLLKAGSWKPDIDVARAEVKQAEAQVARIQADINRLTVSAPIAGSILQVKIRTGEYAQSGVLSQSLILMGNVDVLNVRADIDEKDASRVRGGEKALASARGNAEKKYPLTFVRFEPYVVPKRNLTGDSTERVDTRVLQVIYALPKGSEVYPGQQMDLSIESTKDGGKS